MTVKNISLTAGEGNVLLEIIVKGDKQIITLDAINAISSNMPELDPDDVEYVDASVSGENVIGCVTTAQGQGGLVFVWDTTQQKFIHFSNGEYAVKAVIHKQKFYVLRMVSYWGVEAHLELDYCPLGTMSEDSPLTDVTLDDQTAYSLAKRPSDYEIVFDNDVPVISIRKD